MHEHSANLSVLSAYAIQRHRPLTLQATINLPAHDDDPRDPLAHQLYGFVSLIKLNRHFDDALVNTWNKQRSNFSAQYVAGLEKQLNGLARSFMCQDPNFLDLHTNQQWLKSLVWQLTSGVAESADDSMGFQYPVNMSRDLLMSMASYFPGQGMDLLNSGLVCCSVSTIPRAQTNSIRLKK